MMQYLHKFSVQYLSTFHQDPPSRFPLRPNIPSLPQAPSFCLGWKRLHSVKCPASSQDPLRHFAVRSHNGAIACAAYCRRSSRPSSSAPSRAAQSCAGCEIFWRAASAERCRSCLRAAASTWATSFYTSPYTRRKRIPRWCRNSLELEEEAAGTIRRISSWEEIQWVRTPSTSSDVEAVWSSERIAPIPLLHLPSIWKNENRRQLSICRLDSLNWILTSLNLLMKGEKRTLAETKTQENITTAENRNLLFIRKPHYYYKLWSFYPCTEIMQGKAVN